MNIEKEQQVCNEKPKTARQTMNITTKKYKKKKITHQNQAKRIKTQGIHYRNNTLD